MKKMKIITLLIPVILGGTVLTIPTPQKKNVVLKSGTQATLSNLSAITTGNTTTISGKGTPNTNITLIIPGGSVTVKTNSNGEFTKSLSALANGTTVFAQMGSNVIHTVTKQQAPTENKTIAKVLKDLSCTSDNGMVTITGVTAPNTNITIYPAGQTINIKSNNSGNFTTTFKESSNVINNPIFILADGLEANVVPKPVSKDPTNTKPETAPKTTSKTTSKDTNSSNTSNSNNNNNTATEIQNSNIKVICSGATTAQIGFNPKNMEINVQQNDGFLSFSAGNSNLLGIKIFSGQTGKPVKNILLQYASNSETLASELNGFKFNYGDVIELYYDNTQIEMPVLNGSKNIGNTTGDIEQFKITKDGLVPCQTATKIKPIVLTGTNASLNVSGTTLPNSNVDVEVDGKNFTGKSNAEGAYQIEVANNGDIKSYDKVSVMVPGTTPQYGLVKPVGNVNGNTGIFISSGEGGYSGVPLGCIYFNDATKKMEFHDYNFENNIISNQPINNITGEYTNDPYINSYVSGVVFSINILNSNNQSIASKSFKGTDTIASLVNFINGISFQYGDKIKISYLPISMQVNALNNDKIVNPQGPSMDLEITKNGLENISGQSVIKPGPTMASYVTAPGVVITGWSPIGADYNPEQYLQSLVINQAMKNKVAELTANDTTDYEKAKSIEQFVASLPINTNWGGGATTIDTFEHGGVCEFKAKLYSVLCRQAGLLTRVMNGSISPATNYEMPTDAHSWNEVWIPSQGRWVDVDCMADLFDSKYITETGGRSNVFVKMTMWPANKSYLSYFNSNDENQAWANTATLMYQGPEQYYDFNYGNDPAFRNLFASKLNGGFKLMNLVTGESTNIAFSPNSFKPVITSGDKYITTSTDTSDALKVVVTDSNNNVIKTETFTGNTTIADAQKALDQIDYKLGDKVSITYGGNYAGILESISSAGKTETVFGQPLTIQFTNNGIVQVQ